MRSAPAMVQATNAYVFAALGIGNPLNTGDGFVYQQVGVLNAETGELAARVSLKDSNPRDPIRPGARTIAVSRDGTRAYVALENTGEIAVVDAMTLRGINVHPESGFDDDWHIKLPNGAKPFGMVVDRTNSYLFVTDQNADKNHNGYVYVVDINPASPTYHEVVRTVTVRSQAINVQEGAAPVVAQLIGLRGLDVSLDNRRLYIAAPAQTMSSRGGEDGGPNGSVVVLDLDKLREDIAERGVDLLRQSGQQIDVQFHFNELDITSTRDGMPSTRDEYEGKEPYNILVTPEGVLITDRRSDFTGTALWKDQEVFRGATNERVLEVEIRYVQMILGSGLDAFDVNNSVGITVTPDLKYAFVTGYNRYIQGQFSHDFALHPGKEVGGNIGIIRNPFNLPQFGERALVAATQPIEVNFPDNLVLSADGKQLFAAYQTLKSVYVFDVDKIREIVETSNPTALLVRPIESFVGNPDEVRSIVTPGGLPRGLATQLVFQSPQGPELSVEEFEPEAVEPGETILIKYKVAVEHPERLPAGSTWVEELWITDDGVVDGTGYERLIGAASFNKGGEHELGGTIPLVSENFDPASVPGGMKWVLRVNPQQSFVREANAADNIAVG
ncbi:MAG: hypothetical protein EOP84_18825, partial [Verrucomicrobiaceae bacterium]